MSTVIECPTFLDRISARYPSREFLSEGEVAELLGLRRATLKSWRRTGCSPRYTRIRRAIRYRITDVLAFIEQSTIQANG